MVDTIFLDMDGVVSDWVKSCATLFGTTKEELHRKWPRGHFDIEPALGVSTQELWAKVDAGGAGYWAELDELPWARRLYDECTKIAPTYFLTTPSHEPLSLAGKLAWLQKFTGNSKFRGYLIGQNKFLCAKPGAVLIDDADKNITKFVDAGGAGITFPHVWNKMHEYEGCPCDYVLEQLRRMA